MRWVFRLTIALIACLMASVLPAARAQGARCGGPFLTLSSASGVPGTDVAAEGERFPENAFVTIYYDGAAIATGMTDMGGRFTVIFSIPESCKGSHRVRAEVPDKTAEAYFTVKPGLRVSPEKGTVGTKATVRGEGFARDEGHIELRYYLDGSRYETLATNITANAKGSWKVNIAIPLSTRGQHRLDAQGDDSKLSDVQDAIFKVTPAISLDKSSGLVGESITITGSTFASGETSIQILFDGDPVSTGIKADSQGSWAASFMVPEVPRGTHSITAGGGQTQTGDVSSLAFEVKPAITLSPQEGCVGTEVTVVGRGFAASRDVVVKYEGVQRATARSDANGSFQVSFSVPESRHGERRVTAEDVEGNKTEQPAVFAMESNPPPVPSLLSPSNGGRVGFIGGIRPKFEWSAVWDESGVRYSLQIATSADFAGSSVVVTITGLAGTRYILDSPLSYGTYYWRVQAVDGAANESGWTSSRRLQAGLLPLWAVIVIITGIAVGTILLVRFLLMKKGIHR